MNELSSEMQVGISIVKARLEAEPEIPDIHERAKKAFELARSEDNTWFTTSDDEMFRIGCGALMLVSDEETQELVRKELLVLQSLSAATQGIPVDMGLAMEGLDPDKMIGLLKIYKDVMGD